MMWLFRAFCDEKVRADHDKVKADLATVITERNAARGAYRAANDNYKRANKALADAQLDAQVQQRSADRQLAAVKDAYRKQLADRDELIARMEAELAECRECL